MGMLASLLEFFFGPQQRLRYNPEAPTFDAQCVVRLTDGVYDLLYNQSYAELCARDGQTSCSLWLHEQMDLLGVVRSQHERVIILAKYRNGDRSFRDLPKS